ncbi:unnamed protein product [Acanthoscelides obtectus]|uniref:Gem-associated protein 8 n=1 Tax=Acanthoscelides obtectus TaxID=200917 RepID=A0A9P0L7A9_ACAOB|nr:unnamed protein product [Acanthoscelides obtectus]CAK1663286.1 Gem-associated protein 8 [Acanthoscelides obtectus]
MVLSLENKIFLNYISRKLKLKDRRRSTRNLKRRLRRKRSQERYYSSLRKSRFIREAEELFTSIQIFDPADMEWTSVNSGQALPSEILEWQNRDQIAYWKSRAISLEYENRMLKQHLRNVYAQTIEDYSKQCEMEDDDSGKYSNRSEEKNRQKKASCRTKKKLVTPNLPESKQRADDMKKLYGDKSQKIMGMETAMQLDFERCKEQGKPSYWPNLPLKLRFE